MCVCVCVCVYGCVFQWRSRQGCGGPDLMLEGNIYTHICVCVCEFACFNGFPDEDAKVLISVER